MKDMNKMMDAIEEGSEEFVVNLAKRLWKLQTDDEQLHEVTVYRNDVGYNSADAPWIGRFLDGLNRPAPVNEKPKAKALREKVEEFEVVHLRIRLLKYREQLSHLCTDKEIEDALTAKIIS